MAMNPFEFASKTLLFYSFRRKIERIDFSSLTDDVFDKVLVGLSATKMCVEGGPFTGKYVLKSGALSSLNNEQRLHNVLYILLIEKH